VARNGRGFAGSAARSPSTTSGPRPGGAGGRERYALEAADEGEAPRETGFSPELDAALRSLSAAEREVLALRVVLDLDADSAAAVLGIRRTACSMRLARALGKLEERMESHALA
jgi:DNA-directed RNA polymerase specialized sigma24 family protein